MKDDKSFIGWNEEEKYRHNQAIIDKRHIFTG